MTSWKLSFVRTRTPSSFLTSALAAARMIETKRKTFMLASVGGEGLCLTAGGLTLHQKQTTVTRCTVKLSRLPSLDPHHGSPPLIGSNVRLVALSGWWKTDLSQFPSLTLWINLFFQIFLTLGLEIMPVDLTHWLTMRESCTETCSLFRQSTIKFDIGK